jgi:class 3 adenylate cyclase/CHASE2 domain-containing sensor protein
MTANKLISAHRLIRALLLVFSVAMAVYGARFINVMAVAENWTSDLRVGFLNPWTEQNSDIVILTITENTLALLPYRSPLDRQVIGGVLERLKIAGARAVGLDILFDQPTQPEKDKYLKQMLTSSPFPVTVAWTDEGTGLTPRQFAWQKKFLEGVGTGYSNLNKDPFDGAVRYLFPGRTDNSGPNGAAKWHPAFALKMAESLGFKVPKKAIPIAYRASPAADKPVFKKFPIEAFLRLPDAVLKLWFAKKVILVGADIPFQDRHRTPFSSALGEKVGTLPGVEIHAQVLAQIMDGRLDTGPDWVHEFLVALSLGLTALVVTFAEWRAWVRWTLGALALFSFWAGTMWLYMQGGVLAPIVAPTLAFGTTIGIGSVYDAIRHKRQSREIRTAFSQYLSPKMVNILADDPSNLKLGGEERELTVLFCDVRGFTGISEMYTATGLTDLINRLLTPLTTVILNREGTVDKYMGDCIMAFWNAPLNDDVHERHACLAALEMLAQMPILNAELEREAIQDERKFIPLRVGIGLNTGVAVVGNMGSHQRFDYSVLGDCVNLSARLEGQSKNYGVDIVIGADTYAAVPDLATIELDLIQVKGQTRGVHIYALMGDETVATEPAFQQLRAQINTLLIAYRTQDWAAAKAALAGIDGAGTYSVKGLINLYQSRIAEYEATPPDEDWDGVFVAETK